MKQFKLIWMMAPLGLWIGILSTSAHAAQAVRVNVDLAEVFSGPGNSYEVVGKIPKGTALTASNSPTDGFYKVRTPSGQIAWIAEDSLAIGAAPPASTTNAEPSVKEPQSSQNTTSPSPPMSPLKKSSKKSQSKFRVRGFGGLDLFNLKDVNSRVGFEEFKSGYAVGGQVGYAVTPSVYIGLRVEKIFLSVSAVDADISKNTFQFGVSSMPIMGGAEFAVLKNADFSLDLGAFGGLANSTQFTSQSTTPTAGVTTTYTASPVTLLAKADFNFHFSKMFGVFFEAGYRMLKTDALNATVLRTGSTVTLVNGVEAPLILNLNGPFFGLGVIVSF